MSLRGSIRWIALALLGLVIAAAVALAASHLASQQIGIASESVSAGDSLAPPVSSVNRQRREDHGGQEPDKSSTTTRPHSPSETAPTTEPASPPTAPVEEDDSGGHGEGGDD